MSLIISERMSELSPSAIREMLKNNGPDVIALSGGNPAPELFPAKEMAAIAADIFENHASQALQYGITEGYAPLIDAIRERFQTRYNVGGEDDDFIVVSGGQQVIDLVTKCLVNEGDTVITEEPSFIGALNTFRAYKANLIGIPLDNDGMDIEKLEKALQTEKNVKLIYTIPTFHNPMGVTMSLERRKKLYELAEKYDVAIIEDSPYFELRYSGEYVPCIKSLDKSGRVIFAGSFSKTIAPGIRVGFACGPKEFLAKMTVAKQGVDVHTNLFFQMLIERYMRTCDYDGHIANCCKLYKEKRDRMLDGMDKYFDKRVAYTRPEGGLFIWCFMPEGYKGNEFVSYAVSRGVATVTGTAFDIHPNPDNRGFRLNFSLPSFEEIDKGIKLLADCLNEYIK